jgi:hypothetical protein
MKLNRQNRFFLRNLFHPQVSFYVVIGICVIFLTFLTDDNALEIAISGIASVFIGIGVNNFSSLAIRINDNQIFRSKLGHSIEMLRIVKSQIAIINAEVKQGTYHNINTEFDELEKFIDLSIKILGDEVPQRL